ncbi:hypothetical protein B5K06_08140 [Rhizobium grahamii]|uniref:Uncharacterized protein n=1 Tax=Rhizobium grahamii TaxID=1120045 RepID=A0A370KTF1_9HYPH|nr:hypothetical protein B5K06_08140 [Rhizobium grahamii]
MLPSNKKPMIDTYKKDGEPTAISIAILKAVPIRCCSLGSTASCKSSSNARRRFLISIDKIAWFLPTNSLPD